MTRYFRWAYEQLLPADAGIDTDTAPYALPRNKAPVVANFLTDRPGVLTMRGPITTGVDLGAAGSRLNLCGAMALDTQLLFGAKTPSTTATREPWVAPYRKALTSAALAAGSTAGKSVNVLPGPAAPPAGLAITRGGANTWHGTNGTTYFWVVTANVGGGETTSSNEVTATPVASSGSVILSWTAVPGATSYNVYRATVTGGETTSPALLASGVAAVTFTDPGLLVSAGAAPTINNSVAPTVGAFTFPAGGGPHSSKWTRLGANTYAVAYDTSTAAFTQNGGYVKACPILRAVPSSSIGGAPTVATMPNAPDGVQDVRAHLQRLFALGGRNVPGGITFTGTTANASNQITGMSASALQVGDQISGTNIPVGTTITAISGTTATMSQNAAGANAGLTITQIHQNTLYWTDPLAADMAGAASWKDSVSGLVNQIVVDSDDQNDFGVALAKIGENLAIFKRRSIHVLRGFSSTTFAIKSFTHEQGCIDPRSVVEHDDGCFFVSEQGFMWFDGAHLINYTPNLKTSFVKSVLARVGDAGLDGGFAQCLKLPNDYVMVTVGISPMDGSACVVDFCGLFHVGRKTWSTFSSGAMVGTAPMLVGRHPIYPFVCDDQFLFKMDLVTVPEQAQDGQRGVDAFPSSKLAAIPALWKSRLAALGSPIHHDQIHRFTIDYAFRVAGSTDGQWSGWYVSVLNSDGTVLVPQTQIPAMGDPGSFPYRRQATFDPFTETTDAQLVVQWKDGSNTGGVANNTLGVKQADIHQSIFEFYPSSQQRGE